MGKLRRIIIIVAAFVMAVPVFVPTPASAFPGVGDGTEENPFKITTCEELQLINQDLEAYYVLTRNIDCTDSGELNGGEGFAPIGNMYTAEPFSGTLDGQGYSIDSLVINNMDQGYVFGGLFGAIAEATIKNFDINGIVQGDYFVGGIAGASLASTIENVRSTQLVYGEIPEDEISFGLPFTGVGSIAGITLSGGTVTRSSAHGIVGVGSSGEAAFIAGGGLVGLVMDGSKLSDSYSTADVISVSDGMVMIGGAVGGLFSYIEEIEIIQGIERVYSTGSVQPKDGNLSGGFIGGIQDGYLTDNFSVSAIETESEVLGFGGFAGVFGDDEESSIVNNYLDGQRSGFSTCAEGLVPAGSCTVVNTIESPDPGYFFNPLNQPLANWEFGLIWIAHEDDFPTLNRSYTPYTPPEEEEEDNSDDETPNQLPQYTGSDTPLFPNMPSDQTTDEEDKDSELPSNIFNDIKNNAASATDDNLKNRSGLSFWAIIGFSILVIAITSLAAVRHKKHRP